MWSFAFLLSRIKDYWRLMVGILVVSIPAITYVFGRKDGKATQKYEHLKDAVRTESKRADFYKDIGESTDEAQASRPTTREQLVERLRKHGL